jgi:hypothetical protein
MPELSFVNVNSFAILGTAALVGLALLLRLLRAPRRAWLLCIVLALALIAANLSLRTGDSSLSTSAQVEAALRSGKPTLLEFYSDL